MRNATLSLTLTHRLEIASTSTDFRSYIAPQPLDIAKKFNNYYTEVDHELSREPKIKLDITISPPKDGAKMPLRHFYE